MINNHLQYQHIQSQDTSWAKLEPLTDILSFSTLSTFACFNEYIMIENKYKKRVWIMQVLEMYSNTSFTPKAKLAI